MGKHALILSAGKYQFYERYKPLQKTTADAEGLAEVMNNKNLVVSGSFRSFFYFTFV